MVQVSGRAETVGSPIQLGDFLPERRAVVVNGQTYSAWVTKNRRFPRSVQAELDMARNRYTRVVGPLLAPQDAEDDANAETQASRAQAIEQADVAYARYLTDSLVALVPGLGEQEADLIDQESVVRLLTELGYMDAPEQASETPPTEAKEKDDGPLTGASSPPDSRATTRRAGRKRS